MQAGNVAIYGLGNMGYPLAERIGRQFSTQVFDLDSAQLKRAQEAFGAERIASPEMLADTSIVVLCLPTPAVSLSVLRQIAPHLPTGAVVLETSTVNPEHIVAEQAVLENLGIHLVDASIMAGVGQMVAGTASLALGGNLDAIAKAQPVLDAIASKQTNFGPLGAGAAAKVINNAVAHAVMVVVAEAGALATAAGVDSAKLIALLSDAQMGLHRPLTYRYADRIMKGDYDGGMPLDAARKDSVLALQLAQTLGVPLFAIQGSHSVYDMGVAAGYGRDDYAAVAKLWADWGCPTVPDPATR
ncbi:NAD(P)-dependent oxidoreductase [Pigmentiphaga litoralis]|uniref:3-hydroxyisobutyrate dehydrogenase n=1 Tax=Pigmentiphaga litoralis TaxID=516702 RepID=A0A7Y9LPA9_9BURK|nr:NAD(P)-dependent oxidoreductase [Pigmentiphaga litoralis]NYE22147.1 3-hydroxyisobutyrate dehydrogenase [Pigmentiphaga litoralis]NYE84238.1 3-hydroxyisobutyrate dehydrogenase [Pigmentiphaga litoralis]